MVTTYRPLPLRRYAVIGVLFLALSGAAYAMEPQQFDAETAASQSEYGAARASELTLRAMGMIGTQYKYGGTAPETGFDCSGLVRYLFSDLFGAEMPRTAEEMSRLGDAIDTKYLLPGDLVFYNTLKRAFSHVGIYLGNDKFIHAPARGGRVRIENMGVRYWKQRFNGARRIGGQAE